MHRAAAGHDDCVTVLKVGGERRVGQCYNDLECVAGGGIPSPGSRCGEALQVCRARRCGGHARQTGYPAGHLLCPHQPGPGGREHHS